ncbi:MAG: type I secretion system permease/ATPase [Deltaproteobacteria bacterium]|nr:type I secretion system permease/ATPase [Deltaproteobacteria bacterium]
MNRAFLLKHYFVPAAVFSLLINMLLLSPSLYMLQVYDRVLSSRSLETLWVMTILLLAALAMMGCLELVRSRLLVKSNNALDSAWGPFLLSSMLGKAGNPGVSSYAYGLRDLNTIKQFLGGSGIFAFFDAPWLPIYMFILYLMHPLLFWVSLAGAIIMLLLTIINEKATREPLDAANVAARKASRQVETALRSAETVNAMGMGPAVLARWREINHEAIGLQSFASNRAGIISGATRFFRQALQSIMLGVGAYLVIQDNLSSGVMIAGTILFGRAISPIESAIASWKSLIEARGAYDRLSAFVKSLPDEQVHMQLPPPKGELQLEGVSFGIRQSNKSILKNIGFTLSAGDTLGIIGPSASGKSSLARILTGIWKPTAGIVRMDGADLSSWSRDEIGPHTGYLPQEIELFPGTIAQNIARMGVPDSGKVIAAAQKTGVHQMVLSMPDGYDTPIGEGGTVLSGGQKQRIGMARALYDSPTLLVLDEPDSNLDTEGEAALIKTLGELREAKVTTIVITHKLSLLSQVSRLLLMQDGALALYGPRDAVLERMSKPQPTLPSAPSNQRGADKEAANA